MKYIRFIFFLPFPDPSPIDIPFRPLSDSHRAWSRNPKASSHCCGWRAFYLNSGDSSCPSSRLSELKKVEK